MRSKCRTLLLGVGRPTKGRPEHDIKLPRPKHDVKLLHPGCDVKVHLPWAGR